MKILQRLRILYSKILASVQSMPQDAAYRKYTEQLVNERFSHVKTVSTILILKKKGIWFALLKFETVHVDSLKSDISNI